MLKTLSALTFALFLFVSPVGAMAPPPSPSVGGIDPMPGGFVYSLAFNNRCDTSDQFAYSKAEVVCGMPTSSNKITKQVLFSGCLSSSQIYTLGTKTCLEAFVPSPTPVSTPTSTPVQTTIPSFTPKPSIIPSPTPIRTPVPSIIPTPRPTATPRPGCYYEARAYQCFKAPCPTPATVEVCPTPTPIPTPIVVVTPKPPVVTVNTRVCQIKCNFSSFNAAKRKSCSSKCGGK